MTALTERQAAVLKYIVEHTETHGYPPTVREIGASLGINSTNGVASHLRALRRKGYISTRDHTPRSIVVIHSDPEQPPPLPLAAQIAELATRIDQLERDVGGLRDDVGALHVAAVAREGVSS